MTAANAAAGNQNPAMMMKAKATEPSVVMDGGQAMMAAKAGATYISPFLGRLDDIGEDGMALIREIRAVYDNYDFKTNILAASIRSVYHVRDSALSGADVATIPGKIFKQLLDHPLTDKGLKAFLDDAQKAGVKIQGA